MSKRASTPSDASRPAHPPTLPTASSLPRSSRPLLDPAGLALSVVVAGGLLYASRYLPCLDPFFHTHHKAAEGGAGTPSAGSGGSFRPRATSDMGDALTLPATPRRSSLAEMPAPPLALTNTGLVSPAGATASRSRFPLRTDPLSPDDATRSAAGGFVSTRIGTGSLSVSEPVQSASAFDAMRRERGAFSPVTAASVVAAAPLVPNAAHPVFANAHDTSDTSDTSARLSIPTLPLRELASLLSRPSRNVVIGAPSKFEAPQAEALQTAGAQIAATATAATAVTAAGPIVSALRRGEGIDANAAFSLSGQSGQAGSSAMQSASIYNFEVMGKGQSGSATLYNGTGALAGAGNTWNVLTFTKQTVTNALASNGAASSVALTVTTGTSFGTFTAKNDGVAGNPDQLLTNYFTTATSAQYPPAGDIHFSGLPHNAAFTLDLYGTTGEGIRGTVFDQTLSDYVTIIQSASTYNRINTAFVKGDNYVSFIGTTDANGDIYVTYQRDMLSAQGGYPEGDFNGAQLEINGAASTPEPTVLLLLAPGTMGVIAAHRRRKAA